MKFILLFTFISWPIFAQKAESIISIVESDKFKISAADQTIGEHVVNMIKLVERGYVNHDILQKLVKDLESNKNFKPFEPWFISIRNVSKLKTTSDLILACGQYLNRVETKPLERRLERLAGNYCRERALEAIGRDIEKTDLISDEATLFIQENLKFFLTKKNKKNFAFFIQSQSSRPEILKRLSQEVTTYSVRNEIVPSQEVLKDIMINEQITKLIQAKGFNPLQHQNVFYAEYSKLIESGYRSLDSKPAEEKVKEHFKFLRNYLDLNQDHLPVGLCLVRMNDFAKAVFRGGFKDLSRDIFKFIIKKNNKEIHEDALFFYMWTYLESDDFKGTIAVADNHGLLKRDVVISDPRLRFWIAYSYEKLEKESEAVKRYEDIVFNNPLSYYAIMSTKRLQVLKPDAPATNFFLSDAVKVSSSATLNPSLLDDDYTSSLIRLKVWSKIDSVKMVETELKRISRFSMPELLVKQPTEKQISLKSDLHLLNAKIIQGSKNHLATFRYLYAVLDKKEIVFNRDLLEVLYPQPFLDELTKTLKNDTLDPLVVLSLIRQESVFNPHARSPVGARGLMQLMPSTARRLKRSVRENHLSNPTTNIELGTKYFKNLMKRYDGNLVYVLCAYNAGESRVERWRNLYWDSDETIIKNIEAIPFLETRNYVKLISRNIFFYKLLLEKKEVADTSQANKIFDINLGFKH